jgi:Cu2+-containing amine oxidase
MKTLLTITALFSLAVPAALLAAPPDGKGKPENAALQATENAAKKCKAEHQSMGAQAFAERYGTNPNKRNAFGKCVSGKAQEQVEAQQEGTLNAAKRCKAERQSMGAEAFAERYGTNPNKRNAFGKCVSGKAKQTG